jgi:ABC-type branched-subunit amino acid transport system ATPase component
VIDAAHAPSELEVVDLCCGYDGIEVVHSVSLRVGAGEVVGLLGANGAGKTTLLRAISGLIEAVSGSVVIDGTSVDDETAQARIRRGLGQVPETRGIFFGLTVAEHFRLAGRRGRDTAEQAYYYFPALREIRDRRAGLLSGGEREPDREHLLLADAPRVLLIDELSLGLAPVIVQRVMPIVRQFALDTGASILLVEQHVQLALEIVDRAYVMSRGTLRGEASAEELRADRGGLILSSYLGAGVASEPLPEP